MDTTAQPPLAKRTDTQRSGAVKIDIGTSKTRGIQTIYLGSTADNTRRFYRQAPTLHALSASVVDPHTRTRFGHALLPRDSLGGVYYHLAISNNSDTATVLRCAIAGRYGAATSMITRLYHAQSGQGPEGSDTLTLTLQPRETKTCFVAVGPNAYHQHFLHNVRVAKIGLHNAFPNPFGKQLTVNFRLPFSGMRMAEFSMYNLQGQKVWSKTIDKFFRPGNNVLTIRQNLAAGVYILRMKIVQDKGKKAVFTRMVTCVP